MNKTHVSLTVLKFLYREMVRIRFTEEKLAEKVVSCEIKTPCHLYIGQEAVAVGVCANLKKTDYVLGNHRSHGHFLAKGGSMNELFAEIYGKETGCSKGRGGSMHLIAREVGFLGAQPLVAGTIPIALGVAFASHIKKDNRVTISFFGDGAVEEGVFHEALNFAALKKLSIIFVCENNLYASHLHIKDRRPLNNIYVHGNVHGIESFQMDGQNVIGLFTLMKEKIKNVRAGKGPLLIEVRTYRFCGHVGSIDATADQHTKDIRDPKEVQLWRRRDPLILFENYVLTKKLLEQKDLDKIQINAKQEVLKACKFAINSPYPQVAQLQKYVFKN